MYTHICFVQQFSNSNTWHGRKCGQRVYPQRCARGRWYNATIYNNYNRFNQIGRRNDCNVTPYANLYTNKQTLGDEIHNKQKQPRTWNNESRVQLPYKQNDEWWCHVQSVSHMCTTQHYRVQIAHRVKLLISHRVSIGSIRTSLSWWYCIYCMSIEQWSCVGNTTALKCLIYLTANTIYKRATCIVGKW